MKTQALDLGQVTTEWLGGLFSTLFQIGIHSDDYFVEISMGSEDYLEEAS